MKDERLSICYSGCQEVNLSIPLKMFGMVIHISQLLQKGWIVSLGNIKNSFWVSLPKQHQNNVWWFLMGSLTRHCCCSQSVLWFLLSMKNRVLPAVNRNSAGLESQQHVLHGTDLLIESPVCETQTGTASRAGEQRPCRSVVWLSSLINLLPLGAGLSRCSVWGHGCPGCYGSGPD